MRLFRRRKGFGGLALFALALQLVLSFGHVHLDGGAYGSRVPSATAALACRTITKPAADEQCPLQKPADSGCSICWTIAQAGSLVLAEPPAVPPPAPVAQALLPDCGEAHVAAAATAAFDARGPPSARA